MMEIISEYVSLIKSFVLTTLGVIGYIAVLIFLVIIAFTPEVYCKMRSKIPFSRK